jgi:hypothetical protein
VERPLTLVGIRQQPLVGRNRTNGSSLSDDATPDGWMPRAKKNPSGRHVAAPQKPCERAFPECPRSSPAPSRRLRRLVVGRQDEQRELPSGAGASTPRASQADVTPLPRGRRNRRAGFGIRVRHQRRNV